MSAAAALIGIGQEMLWQYFLMFLRAGPIMSLCPGFGETTVPMRVKLGLALGLTVIAAPALWGGASLPMPAGPLGLGRLVLTETLVGLIIGIGLRLFLLAMQTAGSMAAQATSLSQILGASGATPMPAVGHILMMAALALAMILGLPVRLVALFIASYEGFPMGVVPDAGAVAEWGVGQVAGAFALAFQLAAPFLVVSTLYNLTLGIINRAMPQLMVVFVGAPAITAAGLLGLMLVAPVMLLVWWRALDLFLAAPFAGAP